MKIGSAIAWILLFGLSLCTAAFAQNTSLTGTWKLDTKQSDFGSEPAPKSLTALLKDTEKTFSMHCHGIDDKGKGFSYSWSGPEDGSMHPLMDNGKAAGKMSARKDGDVLVRHSEDPDGSSADYRASVSSDGNTATEETAARSKDGKETKQKTVWHRVAAQKGMDKKSE
jgi:hypothetical protein